MLAMRIPTCGLALLLLVPCLLATVLLGLAAPAAAAEPAEKKPYREIYVPYENLDVLLEGQPKRVFLTRQEYADLMAKAKVTAEQQPPHGVTVLAAEYVIQLEEERARLRGTLTVDVIADGLQTLPLEIAGVGLRHAAIGDQPVSLGKNAQGAAMLLLSKKGIQKIQLEMVAPLQTSPAQQTLKFQLPTPASTTLQLLAPGNVQVKRGAPVIAREVDQQAGVTRFQLLPQRGMVTLDLTLNNEELQRQSVVVARTVLVDEVTSAYERLHATVSLGVLHGEASQFQFGLPEGFEVTEVNSPEVARWEVKPQDGKPVLEVQLREASDETVLLNISATRTGIRKDDWTFPTLQPMNVAGHAAVVGVLVEDRLELTRLSPEGLIGIDTQFLTEALPESVFRAEPGDPQIRPVVAYYAPQAEFGLAAAFRKPESEFDVLTNAVLSLETEQQTIRGRFVLSPQVDKLFSFEFRSPTDWYVTKVATEQGAPLPVERFKEPNAIRSRVTLPAGLVPGQQIEVYFEARSTPADWLDEWDQQAVEFPKFQVVGAGRNTGAIAIQPLEDLDVRPDALGGLTPLDDRQKTDYGLEGVATRFVYRFTDPQYEAKLTALRTLPQLKAESYAFYKIEPNNLVAHYELIYRISRARTDKLSFELPADTPPALSVQGLDGTAVKEFHSSTEDGKRTWKVILAERTQGQVRLAVDFRQRVEEDEPKGLTLPQITPLGVLYQTSIAAVEGNAELDVQLTTDGRKVDVGQLYNADYEVGRRLLGAFEFVGIPSKVSLDVFRRPGFELPPAIVQQAQLVTVVDTRGRTQTAARFQLRTKAPFLEVALPQEAKLWSVFLGNKGITPQREGDSLLVSLPSSAARTLIDLQIVYESDSTSPAVFSTVDVVAPKLFLRKEQGLRDREVPLADLAWQLHVPAGYQLTRAGGTVHTREIGPRELPLVHVGRFLSSLLGSVESSRRNVVSGWTSYPATEATPAQPYYQSDDLLYSDMDESASLEGADAGRFDAPEAEEPAAGGEDRPAELAPPVVRNPAPEPSDAVRRGSRVTFDDSGAMPPPAVPQAPRHWALEGVRSLIIDMETGASQQQFTFRSLGNDPRLTASLVDRRRLQLPAWGIAILVLVVGVLLSLKPWRVKVRYVCGVALAALLVPLVTPWAVQTGPAADMAFFAACWLIPWYLAISLIVGFQRLVRRLRPGAVPATLLLAAVLVAANSSSAVAQQPPADVLQPGQIPEGLLPFLRPPQPVKVPQDAILVPFNSEQGLDGIKKAKQEKLLVPYERYVELWNRAFPDRKIQAPVTPLPYTISSVKYETRLEGDEYLLVRGTLEIDVLGEQPVTVPIPLVGGVLTRAVVDGQPAHLQLIRAQPPAAQPNQAAKQQAGVPEEGVLHELQLTGKGRKKLEVSLRLKLQRQGGWRYAAGRLPTAVAAAVDIVVPMAKTDVHLGGVTDRQRYETTEENESIETALDPNTGALTVSWRPKVAEGQVDQNLTARSLAELDVQEDGLRLTWTLNLEFRRGRRESFTLTVPDDYLVDRVVGANIRSWQVKPGNPHRTLELTLLKPAVEQESFTVLLSRRQAVGDGALSEFDAPVISVPDAVLHRGQIAIRRSPLLELQTVNTSSVNRTDAAAGDRSQLSKIREESPLGIRDYQSFRFVSTPFTIRLSAAPLATARSARWQTIVRVTDEDVNTESRVILDVRHRAEHGLQFAIPKNFIVEQIDAPLGAEWALVQDENRQLLNVYLTQGQIGNFSLVIRGRQPREAGAKEFELPRLELLNTPRQQGDLVLQLDPGFRVRPQQLQGCSPVLMDRVYGWLNQAERQQAQLALHFSAPGYGGSIKVEPRVPQVSGFSVTNVRITDRTIEETVLVQLTVREAGIREASLLLPAWMSNAAIDIPMLQQKIIEPVAADVPRPHEEMVRVRLKLQDEVLGQLRILVQNDRLLTDEEHDAPLVVVETGRTDQQFVTLESSGRDEVVMTVKQGLEELGRQQKSWQQLSQTLGAPLTQAFLIQPNARQPKLRFRTKTRTAVETAGARIGDSTTTLIVDAHGAYRGEQIYKMTNSTEQFLEVELPEGARLWTVNVAGEPVKPTQTPGGNLERVVRVPLIKTAEGDDDYEVSLKYGGQLPKLDGFTSVQFPLPRTRNIQVELSHVRLRLPESHRWFSFGGSMRQEFEQEALQAEKVEYGTRKIRTWMRALKSSNPFARARAANNLKQIGMALHNYNEMSGFTTADNVELQRNALEQQTAIEEAIRTIDQVESAETDELAIGNRERLNYLWERQVTGRARNVVDENRQNFGKVSDGQRGEASFNRRWLAQNSLENPMSGKEIKGGKRITEQRGRRGYVPAKQPAPSKPLGKFSKDGGAPKEEAKKDAERTTPARSQTESALQRYRERLNDRGQNLGQLQSQLQGGQGQSGPTTANDVPADAYEMSQSGGAIGGLAGQPSNQPNTDPFGARPGGGSPQSYSGQAEPGSPAGGGGMGFGGGGSRYGNGPPQFGGFDARTATPDRDGNINLDMALPQPQQQGLAAPVQLASLDVRLPEQGLEYFFTTPRGEIEITAQAIPESRYVQIIRLLGIGLAVVVGASVLAFGRWLPAAVRRER